jgi:branched-chain amino acid transport system ATP-binding protein
MSLLEVKDLHAGYGAVQVLHGINLMVDEGEIAVVLGANGAGKTTLLRALTGMIDAKGSICFAGEEVVGRPTDRIVRLRVAHVPQGRGTITQLTVQENLEIGAYTRTDAAAVKADMDRVYTLFPRLAERRKQAAGSLSGGEQQMLAIGRALMLSPRLLLLDEPSLGLAPLIVRGLFETMATVNRELKTTMLIVEQNANLALKIAQRAYVLETGRFVFDGDAEAVQADESVRRAYLGY